MKINQHNLRVHKLIEGNLFKYGQHMNELAQGRCTSERYVKELEKLRNSLKATVKWLNGLIKDTEG